MKSCLATFLRFVLLQKELNLLIYWIRPNIIRRALVFSLIAVSFNARGQSILYLGNNIDTITLCGNNSFQLQSSNPGTPINQLNWTTTLVNGDGTLAISSNSATQPTFTPSTSSFSLYQVSLSQGTGVATNAYVAVGLPPTFPSIPTQVCENNGPLNIGPIGLTQNLVCDNPSRLDSNGRLFIFNSQGMNDGDVVRFTLRENYTIPGSNTTFSCIDTANFSIKKPTDPTLSLGSSFIIKCQTSTTLSTSPSGGNFLIRESGSSNYVPISSSIQNGSNLNSSLLNSGSAQSLGYYYIDSDGCTSDTAYVSFGVVEPIVGVQAFSAGSYTTLSAVNNVYSFCGNYTAQLYRLNLPNSAIFTSYSIDWGDGITDSAANNGSVSHTYTTSGLYNVSLTIYNTSGCSVTRTINLFYGTTPPVDLGFPGNTTGCYDGTTGITFYFPINNPLDLPVGLDMTFSSNDGSPSITVTTPLLDTSVSPPVTAHPNIIDSSNGNLYYKHTFFDGSCGYSSTLGTVYPNSFYVSAVCASPCGIGADPVGPIYISEAPEAGMTGDSLTCTGTTETFADASTSGNAISLNGNNCDNNIKGVWKIFPSTYTITSGSTGSTPIQAYINDVSYWTTGSNSINVQFNQAGTYTVRRIIGLNNSNDPLCTIDSVERTICVDTVPITSLAISIPDTICIGSAVTTALFEDSINCSESTVYRFTVRNSSNVQVYQSALSTDTSFSWTPNTVGIYYLEYISSNSCGSSTITDTTYVFGADFTVSTPGCAPFSPTILNVASGNYLSYNWAISPTAGASLTGVNTSTPNLSFNDLQYPDNDRLYTLTLSVSSPEGCTITSSENITLYARPVANFSVPIDSCGPIILTPNNSSQPTSNITSYNWIVRDSSNSNLASSTLINPNFSLPRNLSGVDPHSIALTVQDSRGCSDSVMQIFQLNPSPIADFDLVDSICTGTNINTILTNFSLSNDSTSNQLSYNWNIDSSGVVWTYTDSIPSQLLLNNDTTIVSYTISLTVTNAYGCDSTITKTIDVFPSAIADINAIGPLSGCAPFTIDNSILSANHYSSNDSYTWIIDSAGTTVYTQTGRNNLNYTISSANTLLTLKLVVTSGNGCPSDTASVTVNTIPNPNPFWALLDNQGCAPFTPAVDSLAADTTLTHRWIIFNSANNIVATLNGHNPTWPALSNTSNTANEAYTIRHIVEAGTGCKDSLSLNINVLPTPDADFSVTPNTQCAPWTPNITNNSSGNNLSHTWTLDTLGTFTSVATFSGNNNTLPTLNFADLQWPLPDQQYRLALTVTSDSGCTDADTTLLDLYARPAAGFTLNNDSACGPWTFSPVDTSGSNATINSWQWNLYQTGTTNSIATSNLQAPTFTLPQSFSGVQSYTLELTVQDNRGCSDVATQLLYINPTPQASFTLQDTVCTGTNINTLLSNNAQANDNSSNQLRYNWTIDSLGTLFNYTDSIPSHLLRNNDTTTIDYYVTLTVTNQYNCDSTTTDTIQVFPNAIAQLDTLASLTDCAPFTINNSVISANHYYNNGTYTWNIIATDGTNITSFNGRNNLNYTIVQDDTSFVIQLIVTSAKGCTSDTASVTVNTIPNPNPFWALLDNQGCAPFTPAVDSLAADTTLTHRWIIFNSANNIVATLNGHNPTWPALSNTSNTANEAYTIRHIVEAGTGCKDSLSLNINVLPTPDADFSVTPNTQCAPWTPNITNNSSGNNLSHTWTLDTLGTFTSVATFSGNNNTLPTLNFADLQWPLPDQQYRLALTVTSDSGCTDADTTLLDLYARPAAGFTLNNDSACGPWTFSPVDTSGSNATINSWQWNLYQTGTTNSIATSNLQAPTFTLPQSFSGVQSYTLELTVQDNRGCSDVATQLLYINPTPQASFTLQDTVCTGTNINTLLSNNAQANDNSSNQLRYNWTIDSLGTLFNYTDSIPSHLLRNNDTTTIDYYVTLTVTNQYNCDSTTTDTIQVFPNAIAQLDTLASLTDCAPFTINNSVISANHYYNNGTYTWNIIATDGTNITSFNGRNNLNYTIVQDDTSFVIQLIVTSAKGCTSDTASVTVNTIPNPNPFWALLDNQGCAPFTPAVDSLAADTTLTHRWIIFNSANNIVATLNGHNPTWPALSNTSNTANEAYTIRHIVEAGTGCKDSLSLNINVLPTPDADFSVTPNTQCAPWTPNITNNSSGNNLSHTWTLDTLGTFTSVATFSGNNNTLPTLNFADLQWPLPDQQYRLALTVTSDSGCTDADTTLLDLYARPAAGFTLNNDSACGPWTFSPVDTSGSNATINSWQWNLYQTGTTNSIATSNLQAPTFTLPQSFSGVQSYTLELTVQDNRGCSDVATQLLYINPTPQASFTLQDTVCTGTNINTLLSNNAQANDNSSNQLRYNWTIDSLGTLFNYTDSIPSHLLRNNDTTTIDYYVTLTVTNQYNCDSTTTDTIQVFPNAIAQLDTLASLTDCAPFTINNSVISANHYYNNGTYTWNIIATDGTNITSFNGRNNLNYTIVQDDTSFVIQLIVTSAKGCTSDTASVTVNTIPNPNPFWALLDNQGCAPFTPAVDSLAADTTLTHRWIIFNSANNIVATLNGHNPTWPALSNTSNTANEAYTIRHIVEAGTGCKDSLSLNINVLPTPDADFSVTPNTQCAPWTPNITNNSSGNNLSHTWTLDTLGTFTSVATFSGNNNTLPTLNFADLQWPLPDQQYRLALTVTSDSGCTDADTTLLDLYARPAAGFTLNNDSACGPWTFSPVDTSGSNATINSWQWNLYQTGTTNSIATSNLQAPTFTLPQSFSGVQSYTLELTVQDNRGCSDVATQLLYINPTPQASFTLQDTVCTGTNINTLLSNNAQANDNSSNQLRYNWTIDSLGTLFNYTDSIPSHLLRNNDTTTIDYYVTLTVTNQYNCDSTTTDTIQVFPNAIAQLDTLASLTDCAPFTINNSVISANHYYNNGTYTWNIIATDGTNITSFNGRNNLNYTIANSLDSVWVVLEVNSIKGCQTDYDSILVSALPNPDPLFVLASDTGCTAFDISLDSVNQNSGLHVWEIFDSGANQIGPTLTGLNPNFPLLTNSSPFTTANFTISHTVFTVDSTTCDSVYSRTIYVLPLSIPSIDSIGTYCSRDTMSLSSNSSNNSNVGEWLWTIGNDTLLGQNISYFNDNPGDYVISLTTTTLSGCDTIVYDTLTIHSYPEAAGIMGSCGRDTVCLNQAFSFVDSSTSYPFGGTINNYSWDFNNNGTIEYNTVSGNHTFNSTGLKEVKLSVINEFGCIDDTIMSIYVNAPPLAYLDITDSALCGPTSFSIAVSDTGIVDSSFYELYAYSGNSKVTIQTWNSTPVILPILDPNYLRDTIYFMSRTLFNCCGSSTSIDSIIIQTPPVAEFVVLPDSGCTPLNTVLQLDGLIRGQADSAFIDFGDGSTSSLTPTILSSGSGFVYQWGQVPHTFVYGGSFDTTYYVTLSVFNSCGDSSLTLPVYVQPNTVQAAFAASTVNGCAPLTVNFTNYSFNASTTTWCFDWDNSSNTCLGGGSNLVNPTWTFTQSGVYTVALLVDNGCGYDTAFQTITVFPSPTAVISNLNNICLNDTVDFISLSTTPTGWISGYLWEFGDGDSSILQNPSYLYDSADFYSITLTVTSNNGCSDSATSNLTIRPIPEVNFTSTSVCLNDTTFLSNASTISSGTLISNAWDFGDGNSSNLFEPLHVYQNPGTYTINLTHTSDYGCIDSSSTSVLVHDLPQLSFSATLIAGDSCSVPQTYQFTNSSINSIQYYWDFDYANNPGINTSSLTSPTFTFTSSGVYQVALIGETAFGCRDSVFLNILVRDGVEARNSINPLNGCEPLEVMLTDSSYFNSSLDTIQRIEWILGNGNTVIQSAPPFTLNYIYSTYGTYSIQHIVTMTSGCVDTSSIRSISVFPTPQAAFSINQLNINTREFLNQTTYVDSSINYLWRFSDGTISSTLENPVIKFEPSTTGLDSITACLYVSNGYGCADSTCLSFWVWPTNLTLPNAFAPGLDYIGNDALFLPQGHSLEQYEIWIYDKWGNLVWYSDEIEPNYKSPARGWDGTDQTSGEPLPMGVYAWKVRAVFDDGTRWQGRTSAHEKTLPYGTVTLLR